MADIMDVKNVMSGTWGELWLDGEKVSETFKLQAKVTLNKEDVPRCGVMWTASKVKSISGKGSVGLYKLSSRMAKLIGQAIRAGNDLRFVIISKLADPDGLGAERVAIKGVSFDDLTLADWEANNFGKVECPFTFDDFEYLDMVEAE